MNIVKDSDLIWDTDNFDVILVGTTIYCCLPDGFQRKMRRKYPYINDANNTTPYADPRKLGKRLTIQGKPIISLCYISKFKTKNEFIDYNALENCIKTANIEFSGLNVATTVIGSSCFDGNGNRDKIMRILEENSDKMNLTVYDYNQMSRAEENKKQWKYIQSFKKSDPEKYKKLTESRKKNWDKLYL